MKTGLCPDEAAGWWMKGNVGGQGQENQCRVGGEKEGMGVGKPVAEMERGSVVETGRRGTQPDYISQCPLHLGELLS